MLPPLCFWGRRMSEPLSKFEPLPNALAPMRLFAFGSAGAYIAGRSVADGVLLGELGSDLLPLLYVASAVLSTLLSFAFAEALHRLPVWRVSRTLLMLAAASTVMSAWMIQQAPHRMAAVILVCVFAEVRGVIGTILMTTLMHEAFSVEEAKRSVGSIHGFSTLAGIVIGALVGLEASWLQNHRILYATAGLELLAAASISRIRRSVRKQRSSLDLVPFLEAQETAPQERWRRDSWLIGAAGTLIVLRTAVGLLVEFQWKVSAANVIADANDLTAFFGAFYSGMYLLTGILQWLGTERILRRWGIGLAISLLPISLLAASCYGLLARGELALLRALSLAKACDVFKRAFYDPAVQLVSSPIQPQRRRRSIALLNGAVKPLTEITIGLLLLDIEMSIAPKHLFVANLTLIVIWLTVTLFAKKWFDSISAVHPIDRKPECLPVLSER